MMMTMLNIIGLVYLNGVWYYEYYVYEWYIHVWKL